MCLAAIDNNMDSFEMSMFMTTISHEVWYIRKSNLLAYCQNLLSSFWGTFSHFTIKYTYDAVHDV